MTVKVYIWKPIIQNSSLLSAVYRQDVGHVSIEIKIFPRSLYISHRPSSKKKSDLYDSIEYKIQNILCNLLPISTPSPSPRYFEFLETFLKDLNTQDNTKDYTKLEDTESAVSSINCYCLDRLRKKRPADITITLDKLDEKKMFEYYDSYVKNAKYHPLENNCSTVVANIIKASLNCQDEYYSFNPCSFCGFKYEKLLPAAILNKLANLNDISQVDLDDLIKRFKQSKKNYLQKPVQNTLLLLISISVIIILIKAGVKLISHKKFRIWTPNLIESFIDELKEQPRKLCLSTSDTDDTDEN